MNVPPKSAGATPKYFRPELSTTFTSKVSAARNHGKIANFQTRFPDSKRYRISKKILEWCFLAQASTESSWGPNNFQKTLNSGHLNISLSSTSATGKNFEN